MLIAREVDEVLEVLPAAVRYIGRTGTVLRITLSGGRELVSSPVVPLAWSSTAAG